MGQRGPPGAKKPPVFQKFDSHLPMLMALPIGQTACASVTPSGSEQRGGWCLCLMCWTGPGRGFVKAPPPAPPGGGAGGSKAPKKVCTRSQPQTCGPFQESHVPPRGKFFRFVICDWISALSCDFLVWAGGSVDWPWLPILLPPPPTPCPPNASGVGDGPLAPRQGEGMEAAVNAVPASGEVTPAVCSPAERRGTPPWQSTCAPHRSITAVRGLRCIGATAGRRWRN